MKYRTKRDKFFIVLWLVVIIFVNIVLLSPIILDPSLDDKELIPLLIVDVLISAFILSLAAISYELKEDFLLVKAGMIRSKIKYKDITNITFQPNIWVGYRLIFSRDAIEIHYKTGLLGSIVISPENKMQFVEELNKRMEARK